MCITITKITGLITLSHTVYVAMTVRKETEKSQMMKSNLHDIGNIGNVISGCTYI